MLSVLLVCCAQPAYQARGHASYIAEQYAGRMTSSGQVYYPQTLSAAHNTLPFGTEVKVKNNHNGRTVNVVVNDRFPYYPNRVINLSSAAAQQLQIPYHQLADVTVTAKTIPGQQPQQRGGLSSQNAPAPSQPGYGAPPSGYGASQGYGAPASYGAPPNVSAPPSYNVPPGYGPPPAGYGTSAPPSGLGAPPPGYPAAR